MASRKPGGSYISSEEAGQSRSSNACMGFVIRKAKNTAKKFPTNSEELKESYDIFDGGGEHVFVTGLLDKRDTFSAINDHFEIGLIDHYSRFCTT